MDTPSLTLESTETVPCVFHAAPGYFRPAESDIPARSGRGACSDHRSAVFSSAHVEWGTPPDLKAALDKEFGFTLDPCTPGQVWDGCALSWAGHRVFCNPPYGRKAKVEKWLAKGREAECAVFLLPSRTDTAWFHEYALKADEIRFIRGRLKFVGNHRICPKETWLDGAPFPSVLVIFRAAVGGAELAGAMPRPAEDTHERLSGNNDQTLPTPA